MTVVSSCVNGLSYRLFVDTGAPFGPPCRRRGEGTARPGNGVSGVGPSVADRMDAAAPTERRLLMVPYLPVSGGG
jgi:hypothetical protein